MPAFKRSVLPDLRVESVCVKCGFVILIEMHKASLEEAEHCHLETCGMSAQAKRASD